MSNPTEEPSIIPLVRAAFSIANDRSRQCQAAVGLIRGRWTVLAVSTVDVDLEVPGCRNVGCDPWVRVFDVVDLDANLAEVLNRQQQAAGAADAIEMQ